MRNFWPALTIISDKTSLFRRIPKPSPTHYDVGRSLEHDRKICPFLEKLVDPYGYLTSDRTCRYSGHAVRVSFCRRDDDDADDDPFEGFRHSLQRRSDRDRGSDPYLSDHRAADADAATQFVSAAPHAAAPA